MRPSVGSVRSSFFECLYAQCSLHSSEYIASSTWFGGATLLLAHELVLRARQAQRERVLDGREAPRCQACTPSTVMRIDSKIFSPSAEPPISSSTACSGWGINPNTFPRSLLTPAMSCTEPLKFSPSA